MPNIRYVVANRDRRLHGNFPRNQLLPLKDVYSFFCYFSLKSKLYGPFCASHVLSSVLNILLCFFSDNSFTWCLAAEAWLCHLPFLWGSGISFSIEEKLLIL